MEYPYDSYQDLLQRMKELEEKMEELVDLVEEYLPGRKEFFLWQQQNR